MLVNFAMILSSVENDQRKCCTTIYSNHFRAADVLVFLLPYDSVFCRCSGNEMTLKLLSNVVLIGCHGSTLPNTLTIQLIDARSIIITCIIEFKTFFSLNSTNENQFSICSIQSVTFNAFLLN